MEVTPAIGAGGGGGAVGIETQVPAPAVNDGLVVEGAQRHQIVQPGGAALGARNEVVDLAHAGGLLAAGERATGVAGGDRAAQVGGDCGLGLADV
jgi:hypothetical protein